jgi:hypothetical protein
MCGQQSPALEVKQCLDLGTAQQHVHKFPVIFNPASACSTSQHVMGGWCDTCSATISTCGATRVRCVSPSTELIGFFMGGIVNALLVPPEVPSSHRRLSMSRNKRSTFRNRCSTSQVSVSLMSLHSLSLRSVPAIMVSTSSDA